MHQNNFESAMRHSTKAMAVEEEDQEGCAHLRDVVILDDEHPKVEPKLLVQVQE